MSCRVTAIVCRPGYRRPSRRLAPRAARRRALSIDCVARRPIGGVASAPIEIGSRLVVTGRGCVNVSNP
jgi:hypothetical protein